MKGRKGGKKIIIGNWKMNPAREKDAVRLFIEVARGANRLKNTEVVACPPVLYIKNLRKLSRKVALGAQNAFFGDAGAFTGEVSPAMLYDLGVKYVILGHSERRALGEDSGLINKKVKAALAEGLVPILCVGERERDGNHKYFDVVKNQTLECLSGIQKSSIAKVMVAYEPVWAISTTVGRRDATAHDSLEMSIFLRRVLSDKFGADVAKTRILYGGSVNERDAGDFLEHGGVDGLLVGRASLDPKKFIEIIKICEASGK